MADKAAIVEMESRAKEIARRIQWRQPHSEIMRDLDISKRKFDTTIASPFFRTVQENMEKQLWGELDAKFKTEMTDVQRKAREASTDAIEKLITLMTKSGSEGLQRDCANDVIKYSGAIRSDRSAPPVVLNVTAISLLAQAVKDDDARDAGNGNGHS